MTNPSPKPTSPQGEGAARANAMLDEAGAAAKETANDLRRQAEAGVDKATQRVSDEAERGKNRAAGAVADTAGALEEAAASAKEGSPQQQLLSEAARGLSSIADRIEGRSVGEMVGDLSDFARRNPVAFLGGAALAGFAISRFARASNRNRSQSRSEADAHSGRHAAAPESHSHRSPAPSAGAGAAGLSAPAVSTKGQSDV